jgi:glutamate synthase domain-containing protein 1
MLPVKRTLFGRLSRQETFFPDIDSPMGGALQCRQADGICGAIFMCGIVGLFLKDEGLSASLGELLAPMLLSMSERGPDSAGFAIYADGVADAVKITLQANGGALPFGQLAEAVAAGAGCTADATIRANHCILTVPEPAADRVVAWLATMRPDLNVTSIGRRIEIYKDTGLPADVCDRFGLAKMRGTHAIGHTRMATESAVTTDGAHPFSTGSDQCLVHNGSLSNHNSLRRTLAYDGLRFRTDNDSEVAAAYLTWRMRHGMNLAAALDVALDDLDGFYTFVVGTENGFGVLRDPIACKPAVMAETEAYVAFGSEYRALVGLPDIQNAHVWEPDPATVYFWERAA